MRDKFLQFISAASVLMTLSCAFAQPVKIPQGTLVPDQLKWRASAVPDRIVLSWANDPATSVSVTWRTDASVKNAVGQVAVSEGGPKFVDKATVVKAITTPFKTNLGLSHRHTLTFTNLKPETVYVYQVGDGANWSEWAQFKTAATTAKPFSFVYFGDAQNSLKAYWSRVVRQAYADQPKASFFLHAGDLVNRANSDAEWGEWFYASGFIHRSTPCVATPGNHEYAKTLIPGRRTLSDHWKPTFAFPQNGPDRLKESCYWFNYQGVRFISLNSNVDIALQSPWLRDVLKNNDQKWTIVTCHHPLYSAKAGRDNKPLRDEWQPIFDEFKVDLVLQGHDHTYARSGLMTAESDLDTPAPSPEGGTVYVVSVSGPKMYDLGRRPFMKRVAEDTQLYQIISLDGEQLTYRAHTGTGELYDGFTLTKQANGPNKLTEEIPDSKELRR